VIQGPGTPFPPEGAALASTSGRDASSGVPAFGLGLRPGHYGRIEEVLAGPTAGDGTLAGIDWFEALTENYFGPGGNPRRMLELVRARFPVSLHGVSMSLGSADPLDRGYLDQLGGLVAELQPATVSDHLCFTGVGGRHAHDLLPLPMSEEALAHVTDRVLVVQDRLRRPLLVENVSSYLAFQASTITEWEFLGALCQRTGCGLLLDVNNVFVSAHNHGFDPAVYIRSLPVGRVRQIHLAGHSQEGALYLDTHDHPVREEVWELYRLALQVHGPVPTLVEWDARLPPLERVVAEARRARAIAAEVSAERLPGRSAHG
jgi:uncharacterized protein